MMDLKFIEGLFLGLLTGLASHSLRNTEFTQERWETVGGELVTYETYSPLPNVKPAPSGETIESLMEWDEEAESYRLLENPELPRDWNGELVLEDGIVIFSFDKRFMFSLTDQEHQMVVKFANRIFGSQGAGPGETE